MRVTHDNLADLLSDLRSEKDAIYQRVVRLQTYRLDEDGDNEHKRGQSFIMGLWVTALVRHEDGDWCIEFGEMAGRDTVKYPDAGTDAVDDWRQQVGKVCDDCNLIIRPGKIEVI